MVGGWGGGQVAKQDGHGGCSQELAEAVAVSGGLLVAVGCWPDSLASCCCDGRADRLAGLGWAAKEKLGRWTHLKQ